MSEEGVPLQGSAERTRGFMTNAYSFNVPPPVRQKGWIVLNRSATSSSSKTKVIRP
jgi:hypothetical protein